uniref:hypothetical protein n=1 Tax=uncultured Rhizobium sp. TaxID=155567 RepID=UPI00260CEBD6|nr:hypothetical protein [uncultured Rhizobium sp.]
MTSLDDISKKRNVQIAEQVSDLWPEHGQGFELNQFYRKYYGADGWLGSGYLAIWTQEEVLSFRDANPGVYPDRYHFFASDGGGTQFGFFSKDGEISFVSAPDIGGEDDIRVFGSWNDFLRAVARGEYI